MADIITRANFGVNKLRG